MCVDMIQVYVNLAILPGTIAVVIVGTITSTVVEAAETITVCMYVFKV